MSGARGYIPFALGLLLWAIAFLASPGVRNGPGGTGMGGDLAIFMGASLTAQAGQNPYDPRLIYAHEVSFLKRQRLSTPAEQAFMRVGNPPVLFAMLTPLSKLPFVPVALAWMLLGMAAVLAAFAALLRRMTGAIALPLVVAFALMPQTVLSVFYGNVDALVFTGTAGALLLARRHPALAGCAASVAWLKPQVGLPALLVCGLFWTVSHRRFIVGAAAGTVVLLGGSVLTAGTQGMVAWVRSLSGYGGHLSVQPDIASFSGLFAYSAATPVRLTIQACLIAIGLGATWWTWRAVRLSGADPVDASAWLWVLWFLVTPFAHFHDAILLAVPVILLLGRHSKSHRSPGSMLTVTYALLLSVLLFPTVRAGTDVQSLALIPLLSVAAAPIRARVTPRPRMTLVGDAA